MSAWCVIVQHDAVDVYGPFNTRKKAAEWRTALVEEEYSEDFDISELNDADDVWSENMNDIEISVARLNNPD